LLFLLIT